MSPHHFLRRSFRKRYNFQKMVVFPMENINVQVYSLVSEQISPIEKLKTIAKLGFAGAEFTADFTEVPVEEMKKVLAENNLKVRFRSRRSGSD